MTITILILASILTPIALSLGIHPLHFGIIFVVNMVIGLITPPLG
jgi:C4-dicarboxylate transporter DctM subunit